mgnify:CR=1 FL=1
MIEPVEPCGLQVRALVGPLEIQQIHELFNARPCFVKESPCGGELQQPFSTCSATTSHLQRSEPSASTLTSPYASNILSSSTFAHDLLHDIGQLPRQDLAIEVRQNKLPAAHAEFSTPSGILIQFQYLVCEVFPILRFDTDSPA